MDAVLPESAPYAVRFELSSPGALGGVRGAVTERRGGCSEAPFFSLNLGRSSSDRPERVSENEQRVLRALGLPDRVARLRLEHGSRVLPAEHPGLFGPADALMTRDPSLVLWLTVADCFPVVLTAAGGARLLGHCGWRGVAAGLVEAMAESLAGVADCGPADWRAWIGAGIGACCYPVAPSVARVFPSVSVVPGVEGRDPRLDLRSEIRRRLLNAGVGPEGISASGACTSCQAERFFSHRREGVPTGRMAALCWTEENPGRWL